MIKQMIIPIAAFAVTATAASAFNTDMLEKIDVDLTDSQVSALEEAHELKVDGANRAEVKTYLEENGVDSDTIKEIKEAGRAFHQEHREAVQSALESDDYEAFQTAISDTPLAEAIDSEADFATFQAAHDLKKAGEHEDAQELMAELGIEKPEKNGHRGGHGDRGDGEGRGGPRGPQTDA